ncbi:MAG TPA: hypothetical protein VJL88_12045 [Nitrospira sp.]|nr:hypothetical protein [Nitrospira sp.]
MRKHFISIIGLAFLFVGSLLMVALLIAGTGVVGSGHAELILFSPFPAIMFGVGLLTLRSLSYHTDFDPAGITTNFVFGKERIPWESIQSYRNVGFRGKFHGGANIWVWVKYRQPGKSITGCRRALLILEGAGPVVGWSAREYKTQLNEFVPDKDRTSR